MLDGLKRRGLQVIEKVVDQPIDRFTDRGVPHHQGVLNQFFPWYPRVNQQGRTHRNCDSEFVLP